MKFRIHRDKFTAGLQRVLNVVSTRATMPILANVLIEANDGEITLTTTNLDMGVRAKIKADVTKTGSLTLPVRKLASIIKELPALDVEVDAPTRQNTAKITSGTASFRMMGIESGDFPPLPQFNGLHRFTLEQAEFARMLKSVGFAMSSDETRYIMNGIFFEFETKGLTLAATDGRRLAVIEKEMEIEADDVGRLILPANTVNLMERLLGIGETVDIVFNDRQVAFEVKASNVSTENDGILGDIFVVSKVVEGNYPNFRQVIPKDFTLGVKVNRELFARNVARAALVTSDKHNSVKLNIERGKFEIVASSAEFGESSVSFPIEYEGPSNLNAFNPVFLLDALKALVRDEVTFQFKDELSPGIITTPDGFLCVIMPLRVA
jgi:DNA polymerase-3 subunit beta